MTSSLATPARLPSSLRTHTCIKQKPNNQPMSMVVCNRSFDPTPLPPPPPPRLTSGKHDREMYTLKLQVFIESSGGGGVAGVYLFFLNSDPKHVLSINVKNVIFFFIIIIFATEKILCILHEQVFVMFGS